MSSRKPARKPFYLTLRRRWLPAASGPFPKHWTASIAFTAGMIYLPLVEVPWKVSVDQIAYIVGTTSAGNVRLGLYREGPTADLSDGGGLVFETPSTPQGLTNRYQFIGIPETILEAGKYYAAIQGDNVTGTMFASGMDGVPHPFGRFFNQVYGPFSSPCPATLGSSTISSIVLRVRRNLVV